MHFKDNLSDALHIPYLITVYLEMIYYTQIILQQCCCGGHAHHRQLNNEPKSSWGKLHVFGEVGRVGTGRVANKERYMWPQLMLNDWVFLTVSEYSG